MRFRRIPGTEIEILSCMGFHLSYLILTNLKFITGVVSDLNGEKLSIKDVQLVNSSADHSDRTTVIELTMLLFKKVL